MAYGSRTNNEDEYKKVVRTRNRNPPRATMDNNADVTATLVKVVSSHKYGALLKVVEVVTEEKLTINKAYISTDVDRFMHVFHVVDEDGNKVYDDQVGHRIEQALSAGSFRFWGQQERMVEAEEVQNTIELVGKNRPGLLSDVFAVLASLNCNIVASEVWTHDGRLAALVHVTDAGTCTLGTMVDEEPARLDLDTVKRMLLHVLGGSSSDDKAVHAATLLGVGVVEHAERRLHHIMQADRSARRREDGEVAESSCSGGGGGMAPVVVVVEDCKERGCTVVHVRCRDRDKLMFDTVCAITDLRYEVFDGTVIVEGSDARQEFFIRPLRPVDDSTYISPEDRECLRRGLQAAIQRRHTQGLRLEVCCEDRVGLLSDVTRIIREHGLWVTRAKVETRGAQAANVFYVVAASGEPAQAQAVDAVRAMILRAAAGPKKPAGLHSLGKMIRSRCDKLLYNLLPSVPKCLSFSFPEK